MFKKDNRYVTRGVNEEVDIRLQLIMWSMIDKLNDEGNVELDYLQVFKLRKCEEGIVIEHSQEVPEYKEKYVIDLENIEIYTERFLPCVFRWIFLCFAAWEACKNNSSYSKEEIISHMDEYLLKMSPCPLC